MRTLGYTYSRPAVVQHVTTANWVAVFGNGYNNRVGTPAEPYSVRRRYPDWHADRKIDTGVGSVGTPNGLATPAVVDLNGDSSTDYVFAGDLLGNLWKFDMTSTDPALWRVAFDNAGTPTPLFVAMVALPASPSLRGPKWAAVRRE